MSFADEEQAIRGRFNTQWPIAQPTVPVAWEAVDFTPPDNGTAYVRFHILTGKGMQKEMSSAPKSRFVGIIQMTIYVREDQGATPALTLADSFATIFSLALFSAGTSGTIHCKTPSLRPGKSNNGWYERVVDCEYYRDAVA